MYRVLNPSLDMVREPYIKASTHMTLSPKAEAIFSDLAK